jgi:hypothetical protein
MALEIQRLKADLEAKEALLASQPAPKAEDATLLTSG